MTSPEAKPDPIPRPHDEEQRLAALQRYQMLDTPAEDDFDFLTTLAAHVCDAPYAFVSLVDRDRVWDQVEFLGMQAAVAAARRRLQFVGDPRGRRGVGDYRPFHRDPRNRQACRR